MPLQHAGTEAAATEAVRVAGATRILRAKGKELTHHVLACEILLGHKAPLEDVRMNGINLSAYRVCSTAQTEARRRQRVVEARAEARALEVVAMDVDKGSVGRSSSGVEIRGKGCQAEMS